MILIYITKMISKFMFTFWKLLLDRQDTEQAPACRRIYLEQHSSFAVLYTPSLCCVSAGRIQKLDGFFFHCTKGCRIAGLLPHQILSNSDEWFPSYWHQNCAKGKDSQLEEERNYCVNIVLKRFIRDSHQDSHWGEIFQM